MRRICKIAYGMFIDRKVWLLVISKSIPILRNPIERKLFARHFSAAIYNTVPFFYFPDNAVCVAIYFYICSFRLVRCVVRCESVQAISGYRNDNQPAVSYYVCFCQSVVHIFRLTISIALTTTYCYLQTLFIVGFVLSK